MRVVVDLNRCQGYAQCCFLAPETFKLAGEEALVYHPAPNNEHSEKVLRAAASCPVQAIFVEETNHQNGEQKENKEVGEHHD